MNHPVSNFIVSYFYWVFLAILVLNLLQRKYRQKAQRKRGATLYVAIFVFVFYIYAYGIIQLGLSEWFLLVYLAVVGLLVGFYPQTFLPFRLRCASCSKTLSFDRFFYSDDNLCEQCARAASETESTAEADESDDREHPEDPER